MKTKLGLACCVILTTAVLALAAPASGDAAKGKEVFRRCAPCHATDGTTKKMGPNLKGISKEAKMKNGAPPTDANLTAIVKKGGRGMPGYASMLSAEQINDVVAYLKTL